MMNSNVKPNKRKLRKKVFSLLFIYAAILVTFFGLTVAIIAYVIEDEVINQSLLLEAKYLQTEYQTNKNISARGKHFELYFSFNDLPETLKSQVHDKNFDREIETENQKNYHYYHFYIALDQEAFLVVDVSDISLFENISLDLFIMLVAFVLFTLILSIGLTLLMSKKIISPLIELTDVIKNSKSNVPSLPEHILLRDDELGYLTKSLQNSFNDFACAIERESEFTQDVSHELRTPISVMMNTLTLAKGKPLNMVKQEALNQQLKLMNNRVQILLALARAESIDKKSVSLLALVEESILSIHKVVEEKMFNIVIDIPISVKVVANEHLITLMFANLIENAIKYSSDNEMLIQGSEKGMSISNQSNVKVTEELMNKSNKTMESDGFGQGLFLVTRILKSAGWSSKLLPSASQFNLKISFK
jgi:signal transduction histidine kinase